LKFGKQEGEYIKEAREKKKTEREKGNESKEMYEYKHKMHHPRCVLCKLVADRYVKTQLSLYLFH